MSTSHLTHQTIMKIILRSCLRIEKHHISILITSSQKHNITINQPFYYQILSYHNNQTIIQYNINTNLNNLHVESRANSHKIGDRFYPLIANALSCTLKSKDMSVMGYGGLSFGSLDEVIKVDGLMLARECQKKQQSSSGF